MSYKSIVFSVLIILILLQFSVLALSHNYSTESANTNNIDILQVLTYKITVDKPGQYLVFIRINPDVLSLCKGINSDNIYVSSNNEPLPYYVTLIKEDDFIKAIYILVLVDFTDTTKYVNVTIDTQKTYNFSKYVDKIFNVFYYDFSSVKSLEELTKLWKIIDGDKANSLIEFKDNYLYMFMNRTRDYTLAIALKKSFKPPFNIYIVADLSCIDELKYKYNGGIDSLLGLLNTNDIPEYFQPYLYTIADGYSFEVMDWNWPYVRYSVDRKLLTSPPAINPNGMLPISGGTAFIGKIDHDKAIWYLFDAKNNITINWIASRYQELYPVFLLKGNFAYASAIKAYIIGVNNYDLITNNIKLIDTKLMARKVVTVTSTVILSQTGFQHTTVLIALIIIALIIFFLVYQKLKK